MHLLARVHCLLAFLFVSMNLTAQWNAFITNFKKEEFGRGAQTWQIRCWDDNHLFCANKNGVLHYDGTAWQLYKLNNNADVRSVCVSTKRKRIYAGGESEFGYFEPASNGKLVYTQQSAAFTQQHQLFGGYWGIYEVDNLLYYISDRHVVKQIDDTFTAIHSDRKIDCSAIVNGVLYTGTSQGVWMLVGNTWMEAPGNALLQDKTIRALAPYKEGYLIATAFDGLFYGDHFGIQPFTTGAEAFMKQNELFSLAVSEGYIAVGTIHKGLLLMDIEGKKKDYYNDQNGLQNNTILSIYFDHQGDLWLGLDNGIDYISLHNSLTNLYTSPFSKGAGYAALYHNNLLYLGTNRGLFHLFAPVKKGEDAINPRLIANLSGQVWGLEQVGNDIFCLHDKGLFLLKGTGAKAIEGFRGALTCYPFPDDPEKCWIGSYDGLFLIERHNGVWRKGRQVADISYWMKNVCFESPQRLWVKSNEGVTRIDLDIDNFCRKETREYAQQKGLESLEELCLHNVFGKMRFTTASGIYVYDEATDRMVKDELLSPYLFPDKNYSRIVTKGNTLHALSAGHLQTIRFTHGYPVQALQFSFDYTHIDFIKNYEALNPINDTIAIIPNEHGFALLNTTLPPLPDRKELFLQNVYISYPKDSLLYTDNILSYIPNPEIRYKQNSLRFEYGIRSFGQEHEVAFRTRLLPDDLWSAPSSAGVKEYSNLKEGSYTFEVELYIPNGENSVCRFSFTILPPWYRSLYAWIAYIFLFILFYYYLYRWENRRIARKKKAALFDKEQEIDALKNEKLEQELSFKHQEMANLMINFSRKNEILMEIKQQLQKVTSEMKGDAFVKVKRMLIALNNNIDSNIESDDLLKRFEEEFDLVHNNFMKRLREKHTDLTTGEIKMCAYVKMGLSSKEIAPLLNMSLRGTETLRYRLRKKMGLDREASLTEYLQSFN